MNRALVVTTISNYTPDILANIHPAPQHVVPGHRGPEALRGVRIASRRQSMQDCACELRRTPLLGCEYPGEWLWATPRTGLTLLLGEPKVPWKFRSDSSAAHLGVAQRPPGAG